MRFFAHARIRRISHACEFLFSRTRAKNRARVRMRTNFFSRTRAKNRARARVRSKIFACVRVRGGFFFRVRVRARARTHARTRTRARFARAIYNLGRV